jgi:hypothetical protein
VKDCCCKVSAQSLKFQILGSIQELPQGVHAGVFLKTRVVEKAQEFSVLNVGRRRNNFVCGGQVFVKIPCSFRRNRQGGI